ERETASDGRVSVRGAPWQGKRDGEQSRRSQVGGLQKTATSCLHRAVAADNVNFRCAGAELSIHRHRAAEQSMAAGGQRGLSSGPDAFVTAFDASGASLTLSTYHGGSGDDEARAVSRVWARVSPWARCSAASATVTATGPNGRWTSAAALAP